MVTIADVAERAGVSKTTVSHVLSGNRPVAPETRARVDQAIEALGFRPNGLARSLRKRRSQTVALILPDIMNPFYPVLARGLQDALVRSGYHTFLCNTDGQPEQEMEFLTDVVQRRVDGIVMAAVPFETKEVQEAIEIGILVVYIGLSMNHPKVDTIVVDNVRAAMDATQYLLLHGHRRIGMISGTAGRTASEAREVGYRKALQSACILFDPELVLCGNFIPQDGAEAMRNLMALPQRPTAVFCANDLMAIGAMGAARELGLAIPKDVAIIGYDDIEAASLVTPALTTISTHAYEQGHSAGQLLLDRMNGTYQGERRKVLVPHRLIERESV